ncbi:pimeloyl-ACP methyl ester carboxylesterase [Allocatelliglobosispora scoriae]|uniref:Pimeloyl-ACP methyl ester carboxylesterase n=1 Tax=Allocatelliglobosispora scoriae TaxID=643052 RepID=A0A841BZX7_9ACTN|nr:alpha/beta hydrolase [Allocatelliglobosispora scoriae]MBB5873684.1 pimeloyl-ACP methyl ester carboxylesterase [Allocatelliglobosispora scoriae]
METLTSPLAVPRDGRPAVVFLPGAGTIGRDYWNVHRRAAELTTSVIYDRAGTGDGAAADLPRTLTEATDELRSLLHATVEGPYVLVGHSLGGLYARFYATRFPGEVAALLLLDPAHEDYNAAMPAPLREIWEGFDAGEVAASFDELPAEVLQFYRSLFAQELASWPAEVREPLIDYHASPRGLRIGLQEASNLDRIYAEMRAAGPLPDVPLLILSSAEVDPFKTAVSAGIPASLLQGEIDAKLRLYTDFAASVPRGEVRPVAAGHVTIHLRGEEAVAQAVADLVTGRRAGGMGEEGTPPAPVR